MRLMIHRPVPLNLLGLDSVLDCGAAASSLPANTGAGQRSHATVHRTASAFTLIELVISAALMSIILAASYACLRGGISSRRMVESGAEAAQNARVALALITADLRAACPLATNSQFVGMNRMLGKVEADNLDFATHNYRPSGARESDFCEVSYFVNQDATSSKYILWRRRDPTLDPEPFTGGSREEIARGVLGIRFEYYDGWDWYDEWGDPDGRRQFETGALAPANLYGMPDAVRITLWLESNPRSSQSSSTENQTGELPLVFQAVARLNLAPKAARASSDSSSSTNAPNTNAGQAR